MLTFHNSVNIKKVYDIQYINHMKINAEAVSNSNLIPQCKQFQRFGYTQRFCQTTPVCVKYTGKHLPSACDIERYAPPKCSDHTQLAVEVAQLLKSCKKMRDLTARSEYQKDINTE